MAGEVHGEEEQGQLLYNRDATFMGQGEGQRLYFGGFFGGCGLCIHSGAGPLSCSPQTDQVFKVLEVVTKKLDGIIKFVMLMQCIDATVYFGRGKGII